MKYLDFVYKYGEIEAKLRVRWTSLNDGDPVPVEDALAHELLHLLGKCGVHRGCLRSDLSDQGRCFLLVRGLLKEDLRSLREDEIDEADLEAGELPSPHVSLHQITARIRTGRPTIRGRGRRPLISGRFEQGSRLRRRSTSRADRGKVELTVSYG